LRALKYIVPVLILSFLFYKMTIRYVPNVIYSRVKSNMLNQSDIQENELRILPFPEADSRTVVMPNPDFAYVSMFYDVEDGPLHITGDMPDSTYWSVALYEPNTSNHYVKNDMQFGANDLNLLVTHVDQETNLDSGKELVSSPTSEGFLLIRILGTKRTQEEREKIIDVMRTIEVKQLI